MFELNLKIAAADWAQLESMLEDTGALAITQSDGDRKIFDEPGRDNTAEWSTFRVTALYADERLAEQSRQRLAAAGIGEGLTLTPLAEQDWASAWKENWQVQTFAGGLCVCPSWLEPPAAAKHVIEIDPGQAFGTGTHASTALCLDWLGGRGSLAGQTVIDFGCGSAILAIAAAHLGAAPIYAVDIDPLAVEVAHDNVRRNAYEATIRVSHTDDLPAMAADLLIANILFEPLCNLAPAFAHRVKPGGAILLAGILTDQCEALIEHYNDTFDVELAAARDEWVLLCGRRR